MDLLEFCEGRFCDGVKNPRMRDKPDGFDCLDSGGGDDKGEDSDGSDGLLDVLLAGVGQARTGVEHRLFGNGGGTADNDSLRSKPPKIKQNKRLTIVYATEETRNETVER